MQAIEKRHLLLVDDEKDILTTMGMILRAEGFDVRTVSNGHEALEFIESYPCDLVITDIRMQGMDGLQLINMLKEQDETIQVIIMTGYTEIGQAHELVARYNVTGFLSKPLEDIDQLINMVNEALDKRDALIGRL